MNYSIDFAPETKVILQGLWDCFKEHVKNQREQLEMAKEQRAEMNEIKKSFGKK